MDPGSMPATEGDAENPGPAGAESGEPVFRANLDAFGGRAAQLCALLRRGRISADACFLGLTQLWIQLARSHRWRDEDRGTGPEQAPDGARSRDNDASGL